MANIYDIAKAANVSVTTVSLILNHRGDELRIAKKTQEKVFQAAKELNYVPSASARKLISKDRDSIPEIGLLWSVEQNEKFLNSMVYKLNELMTAGRIREMNVTVYPFTNGKIDRLEKMLLGNYLHGLIIPVGDDRDMKYLESRDIKIPVICLYREADKYYAVNVNDKLNGVLAAEIFYKNGVRRVGILDGLYASASSARRFEGFREKAKELGLHIEIQASDIKKNRRGVIYEDPYMAGYYFAEQLVQEKNIPEGIFAQSDAGARGLTAAFQKYNCSVPETVSVIGYGINSRENEEENRISLIIYPMEQIAEQSWLLMNQLCEGKRVEKETVVCEAEVFYGRSCPRPS